MINTVLLENEPRELDFLRTKINECCPTLQISGIAQTIEDAHNLLQSQATDLAFVNPGIPFYNMIYDHTGISRPGIEIIFISNSTAHTLDAIQLQAADYLFRPLEEIALINAVAKVKKRIEYHETVKKNNLLLEKLLSEKRSNERLGIPTMEGYEFISANEIIRCEGLQKYTRIVTSTQTEIISSYNIGEFIKLLKPYNFFSPHKSHLINPEYIKRYLREGTIVLKDKTVIPVSKRRKCEFLKRVVHF